MKKYIIERDISGSNVLDEGELQHAIARANQILVRISPEAKRVQSFLSKGKSFCVVVANEEAIANFLKASDLPNTEVREVTATIDSSQSGGLRLSGRRWRLGTEFANTRQSRRSPGANQIF